MGLGSKMVVASGQGRGDWEVLREELLFFVFIVVLMTQA